MYPIMAPWRSLIYRGVDTPFTYSDDLALIPHMPMHTQSFDCWAPQIVGDWMVSIPAKLNSTSLTEFEVLDTGAEASTTGNPACVSPDQSTQPYSEVKNITLAFDTATTLANQRRDKYHNSPVATWFGYIPPTNANPNPQEPLAPSRYNYCPDRYDIFDPAVLKNPTKQPVPVDGQVMDANNKQVLMPLEGVPNHAHWVIYDPTKVPGDWAPRRPDWEQVLVSQNLPAIVNLTGTDLYVAQLRQAAEKVVVSILQSVTLNPVGSLAQTRIPIGLWKVKSSCNFTGVGKVADYKTTTSGGTQYAAAWMQKLASQIKDSDPVYELTPGEAVHDMICSSCHGVKADSTGRQATILSEMTGGNANVTNLRDGIMQQSNRNSVFSSAPLTSITIDDWAARYFAWMALGGTKQTIPASILAIVANTSLAGTARPIVSVPTDANMLSSAYRLCSNLLPANIDPKDSNSYGIVNNMTVFVVRSAANEFSFEGGMFEYDGTSKNPQTSLIYGNGDVLLWERVCSADNPPPIRALSVTNYSPITLAVKGEYLYPPDLYPPDHQLVDHRGNVVTGVTDTNYFPWCLAKPEDASSIAAVDAWRAQNLATDGQQIPYCPATDKNGNPYIPATDAGGNPISASAAALNYDAVNRWVDRGAINAGLMVFAYLDLLARGANPTPAYDQCESLGTSN